MLMLRLYINTECLNEVNGVEYCTLMHPSSRPRSKLFKQVQYVLVWLRLTLPLILIHLSKTFCVSPHPPSQHKSFSLHKFIYLQACFFFWEKKNLWLNKSFSIILKQCSFDQQCHHCHLLEPLFREHTLSQILIQNGLLLQHQHPEPKARPKSKWPQNPSAPSRNPFIQIKFDPWSKQQKPTFTTTTTCWRRISERGSLRNTHFQTPSFNFDGRNEDPTAQNPIRKVPHFRESRGTSLRGSVSDYRDMQHKRELLHHHHRHHRHHRRHRRHHRHRKGKERRRSHEQAKHQRGNSEPEPFPIEAFSRWKQNRRERTEA